MLYILKDNFWFSTLLYIVIFVLVKFKFLRYLIYATLINLFRNKLSVKIFIAVPNFSIDFTVKIQIF